MPYRFITAGLFVLICATACAFAPYSTDYQLPYSGAGDQAIYIVSHGWHTGIVMPANSVIPRLPQLEKRFPSSPYLEFGWGDRGFYQADEITAGITLKAMLLPSATVMHVVSVPFNAEHYFSNSEVIRLCVTRREMNALSEFIVNSFRVSESSQICSLQNGVYGDSQFYRGSGDYHLLNTCNKWTARGLNSIGLPIRSALSFTADSVLRYAQRVAASSANHC